MNYYNFFTDIGICKKLASTHQSTLVNHYIYFMFY